MTVEALKLWGVCVSSTEKEISKFSSFVGAENTTQGTCYSVTGGANIYGCSVSLLIADFN